MRTVAIIEAPSNLGLKEIIPGKEPGVNKLPQWLKKWGFYQVLHPREIQTVLPSAYSMELDKASGVRNADAIAQYSQLLAHAVKSRLSTNTFPVVLGGDCSILIGNMLGLKAMGNYGLFYLDGHTDFVWPSLSQTGAAAGMDLAIVTGYGHDKLTNISGLKPYVEEKNVWCVGNRYIDEDDYIQAIQSSNINYYDLHHVRQTGLEVCTQSFLNTVQKNNLDGFWIHLDVDVLNDDIMPAVDSRQQDGFSFAELTTILQILLASPKVVGLNITILDPDLDADGAITRNFITHLKPVMEKYLKNLHE